MARDALALLPLPHRLAVHAVRRGDLRDRSLRSLYCRSDSVRGRDAAEQNFDRLSRCWRSVWLSAHTVEPNIEWQSAREAPSELHGDPGTLAVSFSSLAKVHLVGSEPRTGPPDPREIETRRGAARSPDSEDAGRAVGRAVNEHIGCRSHGGTADQTIDDVFQPPPRRQRPEAVAQRSSR